MILHSQELSASIVSFCRLLREHGALVGSDNVIDALNALSQNSFETPEKFRQILRATIPRGTADLSLFDAHYDEFWHGRIRWHRSFPGDEMSEQEKIGEGQNNGRHFLESISEEDSTSINDEGSETRAAPFYSPFTSIAQKDFSDFSDDDLEEISALIQATAQKLAQQFNRRFQSRSDGEVFDFRKTLRRNMKYGGEVLNLTFKQRRRRENRIVLLCDVSKSMDLYNRFLIQFIYGFQTVYRRIDTFVFSASLHRINDQLNNAGFQEALADLSDTVPDWSGGTKIGDSLQQFLADYGAGLLNKHTWLIVMSDGWDAGEIDLLEDAMASLKRRVGRIVWLNPLAGHPAFEPTVRGLQAALPYVDLFASAHNLESLTEAMINLEKLS